MFKSVVLLAAFLIATPAAAQSTFVGGSLLGEFARFGGVDLDEEDVRNRAIIEAPSRNGESLGFDLRLGRALGERWGVEVTFARGGTIEQSVTRRLSSFTILPGIPTVPGLPIPDFEFEMRTDQQHTTIDTAAWVRQELGSRFDLSVFGGVSFLRVEAEQSLQITDGRLAIYLPSPQHLETVTYGVGPMVGAEVIVKFGDHLAVTGGTRLHGVSAGSLSGWLIRPAVGARYFF